MNTTIVSKYDQQLALEEEMVGVGVTRYRQQLEKASQNNLESSTKAGLKLLKTTIEPLSEAIQAQCEEDAKGKHGATPRYLLYLSLLEPDVIAFIAAKSILNSITRRLTLNNAAIIIGGLIEDEVRFSYFQNENSAFFNSVYNRVKVKSSYEYKRTVLIHSMGKAGVAWDAWTTSDKLHLGQTCINLIVESTGLVEIEQVPSGKNDTRYYVMATQKTLDWLSHENKLCELLSPVYLPTIIEPRDWTTPFNGGYHGSLANRLKLVKTYNKPYLDELKNVSMPAVYKAINHIQKTAWRINTNVLEVLEALWTMDSEIANLPPRDDRSPRPCPFAPDRKTREMTPQELDVFRDWKREAASVYEQNIINRSKRLLVSKILYVARKFQDEARIYFPSMLDFRGRVYAVPNFLNPQGPDVAKSLLTFAHGKPIENETAANWLAIHGANVYGYDKVSLEERVQFIHSMNDTIRRIVSDPLTHLEWSQASKPWQFLAFCFEWVGFLEAGYGFVSTLPVALDGSCNGLQHFSAMLRDEVGGEAVNLLPAENPQDIYQRVADVVIQKLQEEIQQDTPDAVLAKQWLQFGIDRKITKRPVMILPYGGTRHACREYIETHLRECFYEGQPNLFASQERDHIFEASQYLAGIVWDSIGEVVVAARDVMGWLRQSASVAAKEGLPVNWTTPSGFPVQQAYREVKKRRIKTQLSGNVLKNIRLTIQEPTETIDKRSQSNGISPNFVHSMDASALHLYVNRALDYGIESFCLVHDSYGTLAADTEISAQCIRDVFVEMYQEDVLETFRSELLDLLTLTNTRTIPPVPPKGTLDLEAVRQSVFFFA